MTTPSSTLIAPRFQAHHFFAVVQQYSFHWKQYLRVLFCIVQLSPNADPARYSLRRGPLLNYRIERLAALPLQLVMVPLLGRE